MGSQARYCNNRPNMRGGYGSKWELVSGGLFLVIPW
jgi:hypothetical protein